MRELNSHVTELSYDPEGVHVETIPYYKKPVPRWKRQLYWVAAGGALAGVSMITAARLDTMYQEHPAAYENYPDFADAARGFAALGGLTVVVSGIAFGQECTGRGRQRGQDN